MQFLILATTFLWLPDGILCPYVTYERRHGHSTDPKDTRSNADFPASDLSLYDSGGGVGGDYAGYDSKEPSDYGSSVYWEYTLEKIEPKPLELECYTCHYTKMKNHDHGMPNCDEPFHAEGIPAVTCKGLCATARTTIGKGEYMMTRSCLPDCQTIYDDVSTVECCYGLLCNGPRGSGVTLARPRSVYATILSSLFALFVTLV